jgi:hypothetical protein
MSRAGVEGVLCQMLFQFSYLAGLNNPAERITMNGARHMNAPQAECRLL